MRYVLVAAMTAVALLGACSDGNRGNEAASAAAQRQGQIDEAIAAIKARRYDEAEVILSGLLSEDPNDPYANLTMGVLKAITDDTAAARRHYQVAIRNGANAPVTQTVTANGETKTVSSTVAAVARGNTSRL